MFAVMREASGRLSAFWWGLIAVRGLLPALFTLAMGALVGAVKGGHSLAGPLVFAGVVFVALNALGPVHDTLSSVVGARTSAWLQDRLMRACVAPPGILHLERPDLADDLALARDFDLGMTGPSMEAAMPRIGSGFAQVLGGAAQAALLIGYHWWAAAVVAGGWIATHVLLRESAMWKVWEDEGVVDAMRHVDYAYKLAVNPPAAKEIRLFGLADWTVAHFAKRRNQMVDAIFEARRLRARPLRWTVVLVVGGNALVFWSLSRDAINGRLGVSSLVVYAAAAIGAVALGFGELDWWFRQTAQPIPRVLAIAGRMGDAGALAAGNQRSAGLPQAEIRFDGVTFAYPTNAQPVLEGFDLTIPAGTSLAIVGQNGAGKTTLAKLLCRLYDPQAGAIVVDGTDVRELDVAEWRSRTAAVFQDFIRYELPLRDNVAPAGASAENVERALELAHAAGVAPVGTVLSRAYVGGTDLSGGQWQRVALARALCAVQMGAGVVILDEPTAQLDVRGEAEIFDGLLAATRGCTTILISHRFSTVRHADRICVLEHGRVVELGSHDELIALGGRYKTMFELQASRFDDNDDAAEEPLDGP
jgi:ATP-binding cassette, subfamily B, bacterial